MDPPETPADVLRDVGRRVAELRAAQGWTQEKMAELLDVNLPYLQRIEGGRENLTVRSLTRLAHILGVRVGALFDPPTERVQRGPGRPRQRKKPEVSGTLSPSAVDAASAEGGPPKGASSRPAAPASADGTVPRSRADEPASKRT